MEDPWNIKARFSRPSASLSSTPNSQLELGSGQFNHPYVAQEVCVIERTIRQDTIGPNLLNFGLQGSSKVARSDSSNSLFALVSGSQQQTRSSYQPGSTARTAYAAPHAQQFQHITSNAGVGAWPANIPSSNRLSGCGNLGSGADFSQFGQSRETTTTHYMKMMALQDGFESTVLRSPNLEILRETLSQVALENSSNVNQQALFSQWLTEIVSKRQWSQSMQGLQSSPASKRPVQQLSEAAVSSNNIQPGGASASRLRVYCASYTGLLLSGELLLTDSGRLDVICSCHSSRMSVAKFSQHAGNYSSNPGDTVHMENGESLVQWRKAFFWQYQVKVPEDNVGWDWDGHESEQAKYKSGFSQNWQKESESSDRGNFSMNRNKYTQFWDDVAAGGNASATQPLQGLTNIGLPSSQQVPNSLHDPRESCSRSYGRSFRGDANTVFGDGQSVLHNFQENTPKIQETTSTSSFRNSAGFGPVSEYFDFINHAGHSYTPALEQQATAREKDVQKSYSLNRWHFGREHVQHEKDILSSFELKLGQPSQQAQPVGAPFTSPIRSHLPFASIDRQKSLLYEKACQQVIDAKMQQELRNTGACVMPSISSANMPTSDHPLANTQSQGSERSNTLNSTCYEIPNAQSDKSVQTNATSVQTVKHFEGHMDHNSILSNSNYEPDGANLQCKLTNLDGNCHLNKLHVYAQNTGNRRIVLESATSTGQLATGASVEERHNFEAFHNSRTLVDMSPWMVSSRFFEGEVDATRGHCMPTEGIRNDCEHCSLASNLVSRDSSKAECRQRIPENVTNLVSTDTSVNANLNPQSLIVGGCHGALCRPHDGLKEKERLSAENENSPQQNLEQTRSWQQSGNKPLQSAAEVSKISEQVYNQWNMQEKQQELNTSNGTITVNHGSHCLDEVVNARCLHTQNGTFQRHGAIEGRLNAVNTETCTNSASPAAETHPMEVNEDKDKLVDSLEVHPNVKEVEGRVTIKCNKASVGQLSTTAAAMPRIVMKNCSSSRPSRLKSFPSEATKDHSWVSPVDGTLEQGANPSTLATSSGHLVSVGENESAMLNNFPDRKMKEQSNSLDEPCSALMQWKDSGKIALKGADLVTTCNPEETFPPQEHLEDDLLSDTASKRASAVADTGNLNKQQLLSDLCSKSSENVLSGFSDGEHLMDEDASQGECESKKRVLNDAVDEGSGIGKCCSSNELEPQGTTNLELPSSTSEYAKKEPRSLKCSPIGKTDYFREAKSTRTKHMDSTIQAILRPDSPMRKSDVELFKVERKKRKTMKWKKLDDTMAAAIEVMDVEEVEPVMNVSQSDAVPMKFMEQESTRVSLNIGFSRKRSLMSPNKGMAQKRKQLVHSPGPSFSFMDETKMVDDSDNLSKKMHEKTNNISKMKPDMIISKDPENCAALRTKEVGRVKCIKLRYASSPSKMQGSQRDAEESAKPFIIKPGIPRELLGRLPCETSATTPSKEKLKPSWGAGGPPTFKNSRTFFGRSNPRNARMVSLSSILKLPVEVPKSLSKDGTRVCVKSRIESEDPKGLRSDVVSDAAVFDHEKQGVTSNNKVSNNGIHTLVLPKEARKRSLWELTGREKDCRMATDFVNPNAADVPRATNRPILYLKNSNQATHAEAGHSGESKSIIPRGARSARAHIHVKANGWQSRQEDLKPGRVQLDVVKASNGLSPMAASNSRSKLFSKEFVTKVDQSLSNFNQQSVSKLERRENLLVPRFTQVNAGSKNRKRRLGEGTLAIPIASASEKHVIKPLEIIDSQANQQSSLGRDSEAVVVSGPVQPKICKSHTSQLEVDNNHKKKKLKRPFFEDHVDVVARKKRWKRFKASTLRRTKNCCVCGSSESDASNKLVNCSQCSVKVHQCCYGVSKVPKASWLCRACKANVSNIVCVLCGYGGGAMTRAQKTRSVVKGLLQAWRALGGTDRKLEDLEPDVCKGHENGGTTESWNYKPLSTKDLSDSDRDKFISGVDSAGHKTVEASRSDMQHEKKILKWKSNSSKILDCPSNKFVSPSCDASREDSSKAISRKFRLQNTVTAASDDPTVTQWVHMVCALWMPGTRCLNLGTMGVFDVSGITSARKRLHRFYPKRTKILLKSRWQFILEYLGGACGVCSICKRQGGSCIQCRVSKCSVPFHVWCAHEKGLLQTEVVDRESGHVGFYGKCMIHGELVNVQDEVVGPAACADKATEFFLEKSSCARTEGYNGRQTLEEKAAFRHQLAICGSAAVSQEQINAWMRINERKTSGRRFIKPPNSDIKIDHREYTRFKQEQGWRRLAVYKSGIHALGLYTAETILKGEMVVEYIGEIVGLRVADKREADYHTGKRMQYKGACYLFRIDKESIIDATRKGGIARFVNHSCLPNCVAKVICVKNQKKVVFFAERDINAGEEITYDYHFNYEKDGDKIPCLCGKEKCRKFLN